MRAARALLVALALCLLAPAGAGQGAVEPGADASVAPAAPVAAPSGASAAELVEAAEGGPQLSTAVEIAILLTVLSLLPAVLITVTSFTRIVIVLSFVRRSLAVNELPPNPVIIGLSLFLTSFVMGPVFARLYDEAYLPYREGELAVDQARDVAWGELRGFLVSNTRPAEIELFQELAGTPGPSSTQATTVAAPSPPSFRVIVPAFILSELKTAFQMGFLLFLPFLVIDLVVASILISMGMFMLPPVMISTPLKILLFVLVDGWHLVCESLVTSFVTT